LSLLALRQLVEVVMNEENKSERTPESPRPASEAAADMSDAMVGQEPFETQKPSQAEGDRDTIEQALREHEESGELY
jgi:hypothetical protein